MTKTTEDLKREMYGQLKKFTEHRLIDSIFMDALEAYLEALRQEAEGLKQNGEILRDAYTHQQVMTIEARKCADAERNRAQAFDFANKSAGEFLQEARAKVKAQRISIGKLKNERDNAMHALKVKTSKLEKALQGLSELRKLQPGTSDQSSGVNIHKSICDGVAIGSHTDCVHPFRNVRWATRENGANYYKCGLCGEQAK